MSEENYTYNTFKTLQHLIQVDEASLLTTENARKNIEQFVESVKQPTVQKKHLRTAITTVPKDAPFDFNDAMWVPVPAVVDEVQMVVEVIYQAGNPKRAFVRVKNDLDFYDGVTAMHMGFQLLEFMEHGDPSKLSPFPFTGTNGDPNVGNFLNFFSQLGRVAFGAVSNLLTPAWWRGAEWVAGPLQCMSAQSGRVSMWYNSVPDGTAHRKLLAAMDQVRTTLGLTHYSVTMNYSPSVRLALVPSLQALGNKDERLAYAALPPKGTGPPPPMDNAHVWMLANTLFFNNYGRHKVDISAKITNVMWDWQGMLESFPCFFFSIQVNGRLFWRACMPSAQWAQVSNHMSVFGEGSQFKQIPFREPTTREKK
jgi:hypothetical protein